jgi:pimeloyl-ACP methyl ester carboxylesterase
VDLPPVKRNFVSIADGQIHFRESWSGQGDALPLLCFHCSPHSSYLYKDILPLLGLKRPTLALDTPGFGESFRPADKPDIWDYARWLAEAGRALGHDRFDVLGQSTGAAVAAAMAVENPRLVRRVVMWAPPLFTPAYPAPIPFPERPVEDGSHLLREWARFVDNPLARANGLSFAERADRFTEVYRGGANAIWGEEAIGAFPLKEVLPRLRHKTLVIRPMDYQPDVVLAASLVPDCEVVERDTPWLSALTLDAPWHADIINAFLERP